MKPCLQRSPISRTLACSHILAPRPPRRVPTARPPHRAHASCAAVSAAELQFGQPVHETHPHLLAAGELTPGITALEYAQRRTRLAAQLPKGAIAVLAAAEVKYRSGAVFWPFWQESGFFWLTGFMEPEALAVIGKSADGEDHIFHLYLRPKDKKAEQWDGARSGLQAAMDVFNADETGDINNIESILKPVISSATEIYTDIPLNPTSSSLLSRFLQPPTPPSSGFAGLLASAKVFPLKPLVNELRALKSDAEIANMRRAGQASGRAFTEVMGKRWATERELAAALEYGFLKRGCESSAYVPVVAAGQNGLAIHYTRNDMAIDPNALILVDAGGTYGSYITDITRTFPASGTFTPAQRDLYTAVLTANRTCIALCRANTPISLNDLHHVAESSLSDSLRALGFDMSAEALHTLFPHHLSHYIGLDVHDTPGLSRRTPLRERQCVTVEPGVYVPDEERWPAPFRGMGVRVEDSVAVGAEGPVVLTTEAVKEVVDLEALRP